MLKMLPKILRGSLALFAVFVVAAVVFGFDPYLVQRVFNAYMMWGAGIAIAFVVGTLFLRVTKRDDD